MPRRPFAFEDGDGHAEHGISQAEPEPPLQLGADAEIAGELAQDIGQPGISLLVAVSAPHAAPDRQIVPHQLVLLDNRYEAKVIGENVDVIDRRDDNQNRSGSFGDDLAAGAR